MRSTVIDRRYRGADVVLYLCNRGGVSDPALQKKRPGVYRNRSDAPESEVNDLRGGSRSQGKPVADAVGDDEVAVALRVVP